MVERDLRDIEALVAVRRFGSQFQLVVESLDNTRGKLLLGPEPVQEKLPMIAQRLGHGLERIQTRVHRPVTPAVQETTGPVGRDVVPEELEILFEQVGPDRFEVGPDQVRQLDLLLLSEVLWALEKAPAAVHEDGVEALVFELSGLLRSDFIDGSVHESHDVVAVQDVDGLRRFLSDDLQVRLPHVATHEAQLSRLFRSQPAEEFQQSLGLAMFSDPQETLASGVDLVDDGQEQVLALPVDLIHSNGPDVGDVAMLQTPLHSAFDGSIDRIPAGLEDLSHLFPAHPLRPASKNPAVGVGQLMLAAGPRDSLDAYTASAAVDATHGIEEHHGDAPEGNEVELARRLCVVDAAAAATPRALGSTVTPCSQPDIDLRLAITLNHLHAFVDERLEIVDPIQDSLELHPAPRFHGGCCNQHRDREGRRMLPFCTGLNGSFASTVSEPEPQSLDRETAAVGAVGAAVRWCEGRPSTSFPRLP